MLMYYISWRKSLVWLNQTYDFRQGNDSGDGDDDDNADDNDGDGGDDYDGDNADNNDGFATSSVPVV